MAGRPLKYSSAEELQELIDAYFEDCQERQVPYTIEGLANACDMVRQTLLDYEERDEFLDTIKKAKSRVHQQLTEGLLVKGHTGYIFYAKNNIPGYKDVSEQNINLSSQNESVADIIARRNAERSNDEK